MRWDRKRRGHLAIATGLALTLAATARAEGAPPLDLRDSTPRPIAVRFEVSPASRPGQLDAIWSRPRPAVLESTAQPDQIRIRIAAREIEAHLQSTGTDVVPDSFSDFVWTLDRESGEVISAEVDGRVREALAVGPFTTRIAVDIAVDMSTRAEAGFRTTRGALGRETHDYCAPGSALAGCTRVSPRRFDARRGYVNAVGSIRAAAPLAVVTAFSPLGEARFHELREAVESAPTAIGIPDPLDAVSSPPPSDGDRDEQGGWHGNAADLSDRNPNGEQG